MRQLDAERASENGDDDAVQKYQNRSDDADGDDNTDNQRERYTDNCKRIPVRHRATMQAFAPGRQGRSSRGLQCSFPSPLVGEGGAVPAFIRCHGRACPGHPRLH